VSLADNFELVGRDRTGRIVLRTGLAAHGRVVVPDRSSSPALDSRDVSGLCKSVAIHPSMKLDDYYERLVPIVYMLSGSP
jgi:hypothetical protein